MNPVTIYGQIVPEYLVWTANIFRVIGAFLLISHVLPCQIRELQHNGGYKSLKFVLLVFTIVLLIANISPTLMLFCNGNTACRASFFDELTFPLGGFGSFIASVILLLIYKGKYKR